MKRLITLIMVITMCIPLASIHVLAAVFSDVPDGKWYSAGVAYCSDRGYVSGYKDGTFLPDKNITRAEFAVIVNKVGKELGVIKADAPLIGNVFEDVENGKWYTQAVLNCAKEGIVSGIGNGKYGVGITITREQAAVMLVKLFGMYYCKEMTIAGITDASYWARAPIALMKYYGIMNGVAEGQFGAKQPVTRGQVATILLAASKIEKDVIDRENSLILPVSACWFILHDDAYEGALEDMNFIGIDYNDLDFADSYEFWFKMWDHVSSMPFTYNESDYRFTANQVKAMAYALIPGFDGQVPKYEAMTAEEKNRIHYWVHPDENTFVFVPNGKGDVSVYVRDYEEKSHGSVEVVVAIKAPPTENGLPLDKDIWHVRMVKNPYVDYEKGRTTYAYRIDSVEPIMAD